MENEGRSGRSGMEKIIRLATAALVMEGLVAGCTPSKTEASETMTKNTPISQANYAETLESIRTTIEVISITGETITIEPTSTSTPEPSLVPSLTPTEMPTATQTEIPTKEVLTQEKIDFLASHEISVGDTSRNVIMMTYDDGGSAERVEWVMSTAEQYGGKITFFMPGNWVEENPDLAREIVARGHLLECHSWDHSEMTALSDEQVRLQITQFLDAVEKAVPGYEVKFIRFPYGSKNDRLKQIAAEYGLQSVMWSLGSGGLNESTYNNVVDNANWGSVVLSHSTRYYDVAAVSDIYATLASQGYVFETVETGRAPEDIWSGK